MVRNVCRLNTCESAPTFTKHFNAHVLFNRVLSRWSKTLIEFSDFSEFMESGKSLKHQLGSLNSLSLTCVLLAL